jgi:DNA polymerase
MHTITLDWESYYSDDLGFKKQTTEEYIRDPLFEEIGFGIKIDGGITNWHSGTREELHKQLRTYDWRNSRLLCHNTLFDGAILKWRFNIVPAMYLDTLCMARAIHGVDAGGSLASLAEKYKLGVKGTEVVDAFGKRRSDFNQISLERYGQYCKNDVELTYGLFNILAARFPESELSLIDMTLRMYIQPMLLVDDTLLITRLEEIKAEKSDLLQSLQDHLGCTDEEEVRKKLASNPQFAEILKSLDITPPMKKSNATGEQTFALAKNDEGFIALTEHADPFVQHLCAVRLGTKSTMEEKRIERFIDISRRNNKCLPIPLKYYGAHTGRWAGLDKVNFQNLPSRDKKKKTLKNALLAPEGYHIVNCDSSQIEARVLAWLAGQDDLIVAFSEGRDVYSEFATKVYSKPVSKADPVERFVGKTCILGLGYGTGATKLQHTLKTTPPGADLSETECRTIVNLYRKENDKIINLWEACDRSINDLTLWIKGKPPYFLDKNHAVQIYPEGVRLPNGLYIRYPNLRILDEGHVYDSRKGPVNLWGGTMVENVVQALARIIVGLQMIKLSARYRPILTVHDSAVCLVPTDELEEGIAFITGVMSTPPDWAQSLPVACEAKYAYSYGDC